MNVLVVQGIARWALNLGAGALVTWGVVDQGSATELAGVLLALVNLAWSVASKKGWVRADG